MNRTTQIIAVIFIIIAGYVFWNTMVGDPEAQNLSSQDVATTVGDAKTLQTLANMRNIRLDDRIFSSPAFQALINTERVIMREPVGRRNPFSPIGTDEQVEDTSSEGGSPGGEETFNSQDGEFLE